MKEGLNDEESEGEGKGIRRGLVCPPPKCAPAIGNLGLLWMPNRASWASVCSPGFSSRKIPRLGSRAREWGYSDLPTAPHAHMEKGAQTSLGAWRCPYLDTDRLSVSAEDPGKSCAFLQTAT